MSGSPLVRCHAGVPITASPIYQDIWCYDTWRRNVVDATRLTGDVLSEGVVPRLRWCSLGLYPMSWCCGESSQCGRYELGFERAHGFLGDSIHGKTYLDKRSLHLFHCEANIVAVFNRIIRPMTFSKPRLRLSGMSRPFMSPVSAFTLHARCEWRPNGDLSNFSTLPV